MTNKGESVAGAYKWEITNYKQYQEYEHGQFVESPVFSIGPYSWILRLYPHEETEKSANTKIDKISLVYQNFDRVVMASFSFTILDSGGEVLIRGSHQGKKEFDLGTCWSMSNMVELSIRKKPVITDSQFIILCEVVIDNSNVYYNIVASQSERLQQFEKFELSINNEEFSDVKFIVENKNLCAHKIILASSSKVFAAMFKHKMKESKENVVEIVDLSYEVMHELFRFIYSGKVPKIKEIAKELLIAADKYQISQLKSMCEQQLCNDLTINNAINYLSFSDTHSAAKLRKSAISFVVQNMKLILDLKEFDEFMNLDAAVVKDILRMLLPNSPEPMSFEAVLKARPKILNSVV